MTEPWSRTDVREGFLRPWRLRHLKHETKVAMGRGLDKGNIKYKDPEVGKGLDGQYGCRKWGCWRIKLCQLLQSYFQNHRPSCSHPKSQTCIATSHFLNTPHLPIFHLLPSGQSYSSLWFGFQLIPSLKPLGSSPTLLQAARLLLLLFASTVYPYFSFFMQLSCIECFLSAEHCSKHFTCINSTLWGRFI